MTGADKQGAANAADDPRLAAALEECLARLDELPATGALLFLGVLPIAGGSGSPARVLALMP